MIKNIIKTRNLIEKQRHELMSAVRALPQNDNIKLLEKIGKPHAKKKTRKKSN